MHVFARNFWTQKVGDTPSEYEDAFWPTTGLDQEGIEFCFAVADGAAESSFPGVWAKLLVRALGKNRLHYDVLISELGRLQKQWARYVRRRSLPWYAEELFHVGGFSSILGLRLIQSSEQGHNGGRWQSMAVGDSCLFHVRGDDLLTAFPLARSEHFNNCPYLLSSNPARNKTLNEHLRIQDGDWLQDDSFYLITDALACWFLRCVERGEKPWTILSEFETRDEKKSFTELIGEQRQQKKMRNDDVTLIRITVD